MHDDRLTADQGLGQAMCLECGSIRAAKTAYLGRGSRPLRCEVCAALTTHAAVNWDGTDVREESNRERSLLDSQLEVEFHDLLKLFRSCHVDVLISEDPGVRPEAEPQGGLVDVVRWLQPEGYLVRLQRDLPLADRVHCLDWAWRSMRPSVARWERCVIESDVDGQLFQRIYNNELENGTRQPS